ncbi:biotin transporter BioY [Aestuariispira insulae]|uniref:Biotin transporter n=1 Tax=Aestuariispira insulae TaxID=1461337 RepID=A0A3D9HVC4_9PROT|nr:biotin transporter BioY [Aestuariispira insulae]RED53407.1 biotin transport system substrate-specific component [Aestuariispira insulae]
MQARSAVSTTISAVLAQYLPGSRGKRGFLLVVAASLLLVLSAKTQVPFWPVPQTMQTFAVMVLPMILGRRLGMAAVALYLFEGAVGFPVFAGTPERGIGIAYMVGPTGGYLVGFLIAACLIGGLAQKGWDRNPVTAAAAMAMGLLCIYGPGLVWLTGFVGVNKAIELGLQPFLFADLAKVILAALLLPGLWKLLSITGFDAAHR